MTEEQAQGSPLLAPQKVRPAGSGPAGQKGKAERRRPTAGELGPKEFCWGTGRRKKAVARVRLRPGSGKILINDRPVDEYFVNPRDQKDVRSPLAAAGSLERYDVWVNVGGGGSTGQAGAVLLGLARALCQADPACVGLMKDNDFLTRDSRIKERKKYGHAAARRSFQFSKR